MLDAYVQYLHAWMVYNIPYGTYKRKKGIHEWTKSIRYWYVHLILSWVLFKFIIVVCDSISVFWPTFSYSVQEILNVHQTDNIVKTLQKESEMAATK